MARLGEWIKLQGIRYRTLRAYRRSRSWQNVRIRECGERLVPVPDRMAVPFYHTERLSSDRTIYVREGVLERLVEADHHLRRYGFELSVYDGWRSVELQDRLYWHYLRASSADAVGLGLVFLNDTDASQIRERFNSLTPDRQALLAFRTRTYVGRVSADPAAPSSHLTGGAVGVWVTEQGFGASLGVRFNQMQEESGAFYHLALMRTILRRRSRFPGNHKRTCWIRERLLLSMTAADFSCYGPLIWHYNYGNQMDALVKRGTARYGLIEP